MTYTPASGERTPGLPCAGAEPDLWFAEHPAKLSLAKALCGRCRLKHPCLAGALDRREPWGVWGGEIVQRGAVLAYKRGRGRPRTTDPPASPRRAPVEDLHNPDREQTAISTMEDRCLTQKPC